MTEKEKEIVGFIADCVAKMSVNNGYLTQDDTARLFGVSIELKKQEERPSTSFTCPDVYKDFVHNYPALEDRVSDWTVALECYRSIYVWVGKSQYLYDYTSKALKPVG